MKKDIISCLCYIMDQLIYNPIQYQLQYINPASGCVVVWQLTLGGVLAGGDGGANWDTGTVGNDTGYDTSDFYSMLAQLIHMGGVSF